MSCGGLGVGVRVLQIGKLPISGSPAQGHLGFRANALDSHRDPFTRSWGDFLTLLPSSNMRMIPSSYPGDAVTTQGANGKPYKPVVPTSGIFTPG